MAKVTVEYTTKHYSSFIVVKDEKGKVLEKKSLRTLVSDYTAQSVLLRDQVKNDLLLISEDV